MSKNPLINALCAGLYIVALVSLIAHGQQLFGPEETILIPMAMLSLFVLSAALMGYLFLYQPAMLFLDGDKQGGARLFLQTVAAFAGVTVCLFAAMALYAALAPAA